MGVVAEVVKVAVVAVAQVVAALVVAVLRFPRIVGGVVGRVCRETNMWWCTSKRRRCAKPNNHTCAFTICTC